VVGFKWRNKLAYFISFILLCLFYSPIFPREVKNMRTTIELITYGKPNLNELPKSEQQVFFETLLKHIQELHKKDKE
jgi:hypothetical protein